MSYKDELSIAAAEAILKTAIDDLISAIDGAYQKYQQLHDAQDGDTAVVWARTLFGLADTGAAVTLTVDAATGVISCTADSGLLDGFRVGRDVKTSTFSQVGNNKTSTEVLAIGTDSITIDNTGLVSETDTSARVEEQANAEEEAKVTALIAAKDRLTQFKDCMDNGVVAQADRRADLLDWTF